MKTRREIKEYLKANYPVNDWKDYLPLYEQFDSTTETLVVQEITDQYLELFEKFDQMHDEDNISDLLRDLEVYKLALTFLHMMNGKIDFKESLAERDKSVDLLRKLVVPHNYRNGIPLRYTPERIKIDIQNLISASEENAQRLLTRKSV